MIQGSNFLSDNGIHLVSNQVKEPHHPSPPPITGKIDLFSPLPQGVCKRVVKYQFQSSIPSWHHHHHQVPGLMALAIISFQTSRSRAADIISITLPAPNKDFRLSSIFSLCLPLLLFLSSLPVMRKCSIPSLLITWPKNVVCCFLIFCINDLLVSASFNTITFFMT